jgi:N-acetylmuramoyl-L-alanine amidase
MKRVLPLLVIAAIAVASLVWAQSASQATLRTAAGDKPISVVQQGSHMFFSAEQVIAALGGSVAPDNQGFRVTFDGRTAAFAPDSRFGVVRDDLIEMPVPPIVVDGHPYVTWQFFQGLFRAGSELDVAWDPAARILDIRPQTQNLVSMQMSVIEIEGISKLVIELSAPADFAVSREPSTYVVRFSTPIRPPFAEQTFDNPHLSKAIFRDNILTLVLTSPDIAGNSYRLENPPRIVFDLKKGEPPVMIGLPEQLKLKTAELPGIRTIVLDPGHGGKDVGAISPDGLQEKDITLQLCQKLVPMLSKLGARVILTRNDDSLVSLTQRTAIANQYKADLFISVHMNAAMSKAARGSETYFLSLEASDELAKKVAERENASSPPARGPLGESGDLKLILWDLAQQEYLKESSRLAEVVQEEMCKAMGVENRGVKQAPFKVLVGATMPAALIEVGFISNPEEEARLKDEKYQETILAALFGAISRFKSEYDIRVGAVPPTTPTSTGAPAVPSTSTQASPSSATAAPAQTATASSKPPAAPKPAPAPAPPKAAPPNPRGAQPSTTSSGRT